MLDPISSIAFEMHAGKGMFALLLGSGVSRAAKIPTGWDITIDLVGQVAALKGESPDPSPEDWYVKTFSKDPEYSELLDQLASTPTLRHKLIRPFIEPNDDHRESGERLPTKAHHAIASLMAKGFIRVVLTTNFDQLLEQALSKLGVTATVVSTADQVEGMLPLVHAGPTIVKLHGDYLDTRIKNTVSELSKYEPELDKLLDQVLDQYGLIACGWSGDWDVALRNAIDRTPSRRFPFYWTTRLEPSTAAKGIIQRRCARLVEIKSADDFFDELHQRVLAVENMNESHPLSSEIAVTRFKEYLLEPRHQIRLHDLLSNQFNQTLECLDDPKFFSFPKDDAGFVAQTEQYMSAVKPMLGLAYTAGMWSSVKQAEVWIDYIADLVESRKRNFSYTYLNDLQLLPATFLFYAFALGALVGQQFSLVGLLTTKKVKVDGEEFALADRLNIATVIQDGGMTKFKLLTQYLGSNWAGVEMVADMLRPISKLRQATFDKTLASLDLSLAFGFQERKPSYFFDFIPLGYCMLSKKLRISLLEAWKLDYAERKINCELCVIAGLKQPPAFEKIESRTGKF